jgi:hypothetical protein
MRFVINHEPHLNAVEQDDVEVTLIDSATAAISLSENIRHYLKQSNGCLSPEAG